MGSMNRRAFLGCSAAVLAGGCGTRNTPALKQPLPEHPNFIVFLSDTLRADHLSCYGFTRPTTPNIDEFSRSAVLFEQCFAAATWTLPATASLLTGVHPLVHRTVIAEWSEEGLARGFQHQVLPPSITTTAAELQARGYTTAGFQANPNATGERGLSRGFQHYFLDVNAPPERSIDALIDWIENDAVEPFYAYVHLIDPHEPYAADPQIFERLHGKSLETWVASLPEAEAAQLRDYHQRSWNDLFIVENRLDTEVLRDFSPDAVQYFMALYDSEIRRVDREFGRLTRWMRERGLDQDTVTVLTSDHGEAFGEDSMFYHGSRLHDPQIHIPLIIGLPGQQRRTRSPWSVSQCDIHPTLLALANVSAHDPASGSMLLRRTGELVHAYDRPVLSALDLHRSNPDHWQFRLTRGALQVEGTSDFNLVAIKERGKGDSSTMVRMTELSSLADRNWRQAVEDFYLARYEMSRRATTVEYPTWLQVEHFDEETFKAMGYL